MDKIEKVISLLNKCESILFITGAGVSAESGLPTYRGIGGLYNDKVTEDGIPIEMALAGETLQNHPEITWKYLLKIEQKCRQATYNRAHEVIAQMERHFKRVWVLTQNIDGFHQRAGSKNVVDIHGDAHKVVCPGCGWHTVVDDYKGVSIPPLCPECNNIVRPDVVFFGEMLPADKTQLLMRELEIGFDLYISVGTTSVFPYISQPILFANQLGRSTVEINPGQTPVSDIVDIKISQGAAKTLDAIWHEYSRQNKVNN